MASDNVVDNIAVACEHLGEIELAGISLESADYRLLDVNHMGLDLHVAMQPSAVAYYGSLLKDSARRLDSMKRQYNRWEKKKMAEARISVENGTKAISTIRAADIEARFIVDNETEIENWEKQQDKLQREFDTLSVWFEAWKQKSFSIREYANITEEERFNNNTSIRSNSSHEKTFDRDQGISRVKSIIRKRQDSNEEFFM